MFSLSLGLQHHAAYAQAPAVPGTMQIRIEFSTPGREPVTGALIGVRNNAVEVQIPQGRIPYPLQQIKKVTVGVPPEYNQAIAALQQRDTDKALALINALATRYKGLPTEWAQNSTAMLVDLYLSKSDVLKAKSSLADLQKFYPSASGPTIEMGAARIAFAEGDKATAREKAAPIAEAALKEKSINSGLARAYSQAFLVMGQVNESEGDLSAALENYLRVVTLFWNDPAAVATAQERADALRKKNASLTAP